MKILVVKIEDAIDMLSEGADFWYENHPGMSVLEELIAWKDIGLRLYHTRARLLEAVENPDTLTMEILQNDL